MFVLRKTIQAHIYPAQSPNSHMKSRPSFCGQREWRTELGLTH